MAREPKRRDQAKGGSPKPKGHKKAQEEPVDFSSHPLTIRREIEEERQRQEEIDKRFEESIKNLVDRFVKFAVSIEQEESGNVSKDREGLIVYRLFQNIIGFPEFEKEIKDRYSEIEEIERALEKKIKEEEEIERRKKRVVAKERSEPMDTDTESGRASEKPRYGHKGKRLRPSEDDETTKKLMTLFKSKADRIDALAARRDWSASYYLSKILDGDPEIHAEFFGDQEP